MRYFRRLLPTSSISPLREENAPSSDTLGLQTTNTDTPICGRRMFSICGDASFPCEGVFLNHRTQLTVSATIPVGTSPPPPSRDRSTTTVDPVIRLLLEMKLLRFPARNPNDDMWVVLTSHLRPVVIRPVHNGPKGTTPTTSVSKVPFRSNSVFTPGGQNITVEKQECNRTSSDDALLNLPAAWIAAISWCHSPPWNPRTTTTLRAPVSDGFDNAASQIVRHFSKSLVS
mmetsp:Transcript_40139/g.46786  ORF Transcript_40139/g.46786 Transcript_40139/m.46786 type:complete len:229 (-) Transcript_40139:460-1146(-)